MVFFVLLTLGFIFELGKNALTIDSRQTSSYNNDTTLPVSFIANNILQSSVLPDVVEVLHDVVKVIEAIGSTIPSGETLYETVRDRVADTTSIPQVVDSWASNKEQELTAAYETAKNCVSTGASAGASAGDIEAAKNSAEEAYDCAKDNLKESAELAKEIYEDRR